MIRLTAFACLCLSLNSGVLAQNQPSRGSKPSTKAPAKPKAPEAPAAEPSAALPPLSAVELSPEYFKVPSAGLIMHLPVGSQTQTTGAGEAISTQVMAKDQSWLINIKTAVTKSHRTATEVATEVRDQLLAMVAPIEKGRDQQLKNGQTRARVLKDVSPLVIATEKPDQARPAANFYLSMPRGEKDSPIVRGYTVFEVAPGRYVTFDLAVPEPNFAAARSAFETSVGTARFADAAAASAARGSAVERGMELLGKLSAADLDAACAEMTDQWFRLYTPGKNGDDQEIAYRHVRAWKGKRGELDSARDSKHWTVEDHQEGYLIEIKARMLQEGKIFDSIGTYFMAPDRREEAWLLQMVVKDPSQRKPATWKEIGARSEKSMSVSTEGSGESRTAQPMVPEKGYLNQVEAFLLPQLLVRAKADPADYGFYEYQSTSGNGVVALRRDVLAAGGDGAWTITTTLKEDAEPQISAYSASGLLVKTTLGNGNTWVPIQLKTLADIWQAKRLPMD
jgi:hypothetical protein